MNSKLHLTFNLDPQPPLPFKAAEDYAATVLEWSSIPPDHAVAHRDIAYGPHPRQRMDIFAPPDAVGAPILVFLHGGGWTNGYKEFTGFMADAVTRRGFVLVAPGYRLAPENPLPAALDDCLSVLKFLAGNGNAFGADPARIYLAGHSAGGHVATMTALRKDALAGTGLTPRAIRACLPISGIMDLHHPNPPPGSIEERVYTQVLQPGAQDALMSPICWAAGNTTPMFLSHGDRDSARVMLSNERFEAILSAQPGHVERAIEPGRDHFQTHLDLRGENHPWYVRLEKLARNA